MEVNIDIVALYKYATRKRFESDTLEVNQQFERLLKYIKDSLDWDIVSNVANYIKSSIVDKESIVKMLQSRKLDKDNQKILAEIENLQDRANYDLSYGLSQFAKDLFAILESNKENLRHIITNIPSLTYYIEEIKQYDSANTNIYHQFGIEVLKDYLKHLDMKQDNNKALDEIFGFDESLKVYFQELCKKDKNTLLSVENILKSLSYVITNASWHNEPQILSQLSQEQIEKYLIANPEFVKACIRFMQWDSKKNQQEFQVFKANLIEAIKKLSKSNNINYSLRMKKMIDYFGLEKDEEKI